VHALLGFPSGTPDESWHVLATAAFARFRSERVDLKGFRERCLEEPDLLQGFIFYDGLV